MLLSLCILLQVYLIFYLPLNWSLCRPVSWYCWVDLRAAAFCFAWLACVWCCRQLCFVAEWTAPLRAQQTTRSRGRRGWRGEGWSGKGKAGKCWKKIKAMREGCKKRGGGVDKWVRREGWSKGEKQKWGKDCDAEEKRIKKWPLLLWEGR